MKKIASLAFLLLFFGFPAVSANKKITITNATAHNLLIYNKFAQESALLSKSGGEGHFFVRDGLRGRSLFLVGNSVHDKEDITLGYYHFGIWYPVDFDAGNCENFCSLIFSPATLRLEKTPWQDEKQEEIDPSFGNTLQLWPTILRFNNMGKSNISILFGEESYTIPPNYGLSVFINKIDDLSRVKFNYKSKFLSSSKPRNIMDLLSQCADLSSEQISLCTYAISSKYGVAIAKKENMDLLPFFASKQELGENFLRFEEQRQAPDKDPAIIDQVISRLPLWKKKRNLETTALFAQLNKFETITTHTAAFAFFSALKQRLEAKLGERYSFLAAAQRGDSRGLARALRAGADVDQTRPGDGKNVLHILAEVGDDRLVQRFLQISPRLLNSLDLNGRSPLYLALEAMPYELGRKALRKRAPDQHNTIKTLFNAGGRIRPQEGEDSKAANPLASTKIGNNLGGVNEQEDLTTTYGPQNIFEDLGKDAIWSLSQALVKKQPWALSFDGALDFIALNRRLVAYLQEAHGQAFDSYLMGLSRLKDKNEMATFMSKVRQGSDVYAKQMLSRLRHKNYHNTDSFSLFEGPYRDLPSDRKALEQAKLQKLVSANVCHLAQKPSGPGYLRLCCFDIIDENLAAVRHTSPQVLVPAMSEMALIFKNIVEDPHAGIESIAKMHWWLAQTTPHIRGGGAIAEWMAIALMEFKGIEFRGWAPQVETWSEAMIYSEHEFVERYTQFFLR